METRQKLFASLLALNSQVNKLLLFLRKKKRAFFVIILLAVLLAGAIIKVEHYHKDFLIKERLINQYYNNIMASNFGDAYSTLCEAWEEKDYVKFFGALLEICGLSILSPLFLLYPNLPFQIYIKIEENAFKY